MNFLKIESYKTGIMLSSVFNLISKFLLFFTNIIIAYYFGTQVSTDIYFYILSVITLVAIFVVSINQAVIIPEMMRRTVQQGHNDAMGFMNRFILIYAIIGFLMTFILCIRPVLVMRLISNFPEEMLMTHSTLIFAGIPLLTLIVICMLFNDILTSQKYFTVPMIMEIMNGIVVLIIIFIFHTKYGIVSVLSGLLSAYTIQLCILIYLMKKNIHWDFSFRPVQIPLKTIKDVIISQAGNVATLLSGYIPLLLLSSFSAGIITALNYGQKTADIPTTLITVQFSSILGIYFNELYAKKEFEKLNEIFVSASKILFFILVPVSALTYLHSTEIIILLFRRGEFNDFSVATSSEFLKYFALVIPLLPINTLIARLFMASQMLKRAVLYQITMNALLIGQIYVGINVLGAKGYPLALLLNHAIGIVVLYFILKRSYWMIQYSTVLFYFLKVILFNVFIFFMLLYLKSTIITVSSPLLNLMAGGFIYLLALVMLNVATNLNKDMNQGITFMKGMFKLT